MQNQVADFLSQQNHRSPLRKLRNGTARWESQTPFWVPVTSLLFRPYQALEFPQRGRCTITDGNCSQNFVSIRMSPGVLRFLHTLVDKGVVSFCPDGVVSRNFGPANYNCQPDN